jgi:hypothetical protein
MYFNSLFSKKHKKLDGWKSGIALTKPDFIAECIEEFIIYWIFIFECLSENCFYVLSKVLKATVVARTTTGQPPPAVNPGVTDRNRVNDDHPLLLRSWREGRGSISPCGDPLCHPHDTLY